MLASWKAIAVFSDDTPEGRKVADQAAAIADRCGAHLIGIYAVTGHPGELPADAFVRGTAAIDEMLTRHRTAEKRLAMNVKRHFASVVGRHSISSEFRLMGSEQTWDDPLIHALHSDLIVLGYPHSPGLSKPWSSERLVLASGVPALLIPQSRASTAVGQNILVAWNGSREARRAFIDALPILKLAKSVTVLVVDAVETPDRFGAEPGADISLYLARHDVAVQLRQVTSQGISRTGDPGKCRASGQRSGCNWRLQSRAARRADLRWSDTRAFGLFLKTFAAIALMRLRPEMATSSGQDRVTAWILETDPNRENATSATGHGFEWRAR